MKEKELQISLKKLGDRIREIRESKNISQRLLALECGWEKSNYSKLELGKVNPTYKTLLILSKTLEIDVKDIFNFQ